MIYLNDDNFEEEVMKSDKPVLVDFYADWCGPCKMMGPVIEQIASETDDVKVCKCDVDNAQQLAVSYNVMSIPTLILFKDGAVAKRSVGAIPKQSILELLQ
ncbi:MAG: thioredoxin [Clostridium sp.]|nr:thioredoxin [Clostridium sp.]MCM1398790.1 thioredoxin [Clostridium sp.]MCM1458578.1 thioredoxin [Bacteroides sp.]